jgi:HEAT repeat protein
VISYCSKCLRLFPPEQPAAGGTCPFDGAALGQDPLLGETVGDYRITGLIGEGGMGVVFSAEHQTLRRRAAFKVLRAELRGDPTETARFLSEARVISRIGHKNLIDIFDIGELPDGRLYYVMELLTGRSLSSVMKAQRLPFAVFLPLLRQACEGISAAHAAGVIHRDLKPDNLFLVERPGEPVGVKVLDFGVAKVLSPGQESAEAKLTRTGHIVGTPQYMAPEQIDGSSPIDARSDVYAMGVILYELATGALPFRGETVGQLLRAHLMEEVPELNPSSLAPGVPQELEAVIGKALAKHPDDRYPSVRALAEDLERVGAGQTADAAAWWQGELSRRATLPQGPKGQRGRTGTLPAQAGPTVAQTQASTVLDTVLKGPQARRWQALIGGVAVGLLVLTGGGAALMYRRGQELRRAEERLREERARMQQRKQREQEEAMAQRKRRIDLVALRSQALGVLQEGLKDGDPSLRLRALLGLSQSRDTRHRTLIEPLLRDADLLVVAQALTALGQLGARPAAAAILQLVGERGDQAPAEVALPAAEALDRLGAPLGETMLRKLIKGKDPQGQLRAALALLERDPQDKAARKLLQKRRKRKDAPVAEVVGILSRLARAGDEKAKEELAARLQEGGEDPPEVRLTVAATLARLGDDRGRELLAKAAREAGADERGAGRQLLAARLLAELDDASGYDLFRAVFTDGKRQLAERVVAAEGLGACGQKPGAKVLSTALPKEAADVVLRQAAAGGILQIAGGDPQILAQQSLSWAQDALGDPDWAVREAAVAMLGDAEPGQAVPLLKRALHDERTEVRKGAARALGRTRARAAVAVLAGALTDRVGEVRIAALQSIGQVGTQLRQRGEKIAAEVASLREALLQRADQGEAGEKVVAAAALLRLGDESRRERLKEGLAAADPAVRQLAVEEARADPGTAKAALLAALKDESDLVRLRAARELAEGGDKEGVAVLREALKKGGEGGLLAYAALSKLGEEAAAPAGLGALLASGRVAERIAVVEAAAQMPEAAALPILRRLLSDPDVAVRSRAGALLARISPPDPERGPEREKKQGEAAPAQAQAPAQAAPDMMAAPAAPAPDLGMAEDPRTALPASKEPKETREGRAASAREEAQIRLAAAELNLQNGKYDRAAREFEAARKLDSKLNVAFSLGEAYRRWADTERNLDRQKQLVKKAIDAYKKARDPRAKAYIEELKERLE